MDLDPTRKAEVAFNRRKIKTLATDKRPFASPMGKGYHLERESYVAGGKQTNPFSGSRLRDEMTNMKQDADDAVTWRLNYGNVDPANKRLQQLLDKGFEAMSLSDFQKLLRSEEHTSELQSPYDLVCRLLLEKKKT